jgi:hypothetical protein
MSTHWKKKIVGPYLVTFSLFWAPKTHFHVGRHENKEKRLFYFGLRIFLPIQIQLKEIENPKIDCPYSTFSKNSVSWG